MISTAGDICRKKKRHNLTTSIQYLRNYCPPLTLSWCSGTPVIEFLQYPSWFSNTKFIHNCVHSLVTLTHQHSAHTHSGKVGAALMRLSTGPVNF
ncbi:hypothetical protein R6Q59_019470 [Mikania micrantha]